MEVLIIGIAMIMPTVFMVIMTRALYIDSRNRGNSVLVSVAFGLLGPLLAIGAMILVSSVPNWLF
jgi:heme A synthase